MRRVLLIVLAGIVTALVIFAIVVALQPAQFRVERTATIAAPAPIVFTQVNDFHNWQAWSPWAKLDPAMQVTYEGAPSGTGAVYRWVGNKQVGEGSATIIESRPNELVRIQLDFVKPITATDIAEFDLEPAGDQVAVTWSLSGENNFLCKAVNLVMNMDRMLGAMFEQGLADMKARAEAEAAQQ
jgi:hypothetical protein